MPDEHTCEVFRRKDDVDAMREFTAWLRDGGMKDLREMQKVSDEYNTIKDMGFKAILHLLGVGILLVFGIVAYSLVWEKQ
jgi:hypothetical protein